VNDGVSIAEEYLWRNVLGLQDVSEILFFGHASMVAFLVNNSYLNWISCKFRLQLVIPYIKTPTALEPLDSINANTSEILAESICLVLGFYIYSYEGLEYREQLKEETEVK
jgi:hypothetical protein